MRIFKRVKCTHCKKYTDYNLKKDKIKKEVCVFCGEMFNITSRNYDYYIDYAFEGGRFRENVGNSKATAEIILAKIKSNIAEGKHLDVVKKEKIKFEVFAQEYLDVHSKQHKKSWETDLHIIKILNRFFKGKCLSEITTKDIEQFKLARSNEKVAKRTISNATVNRELDTLSGIFNKAVAWGRLKASPMKSVKALKVPQGRLRFLEEEQIVNLLSNCTGNLKAIVTLALFTGMRRGEIFGLKWYDIDSKRNIITLLDTKNGDKREVPMNEQVQNALINLKKHPKCEYIFCDENGVPVHDIRKSYSTALKKSGITNFRFHDLRHTFASQLVMSGIDLNTVRELLGHRDLTMTLRYSHLSCNHRQKAVDTLAERFGIQLAYDTNLQKSEKTEVLVSS